MHNSDYKTSETRLEINYFYWAINLIFHQPVGNCYCPFEPVDTKTAGQNSIFNNK